MRKKLLSILALLCLTVTSAWAESWTSGDCTVTLSGDVLTVSKTSGTGAMADYSSTSDRPWHAERASVTSVVIESGVTTIGNRAFQNFSTCAVEELCSECESWFHPDEHVTSLIVHP